MHLVNCHRNSKTLANGVQVQSIERLLLQLGSGNDVIRALDGNDVLFGGDGNDSLVGGAGVDIINGGFGIDTISLGAGQDQVIGSLAELDGDVIQDFELNESITVEGALVASVSTVMDGNSTLLQFDQNGDGNSEAVLRLSGFTQAATFKTTYINGNTVVSPSVGRSNTAPVADAETFDIALDETLYISVTTLLDGDTDADGDVLTVIDASNAVNGTVMLDTKGDTDATNDIVVFTPLSGYSGAASFDYTVADGYGGIDRQTVTIAITGFNSNLPPALTGFPAILADGLEDVDYTVNTTDLLTGWTDGDLDVLRVAHLAADHGTVTDNHDDTYTIKPEPDYNGEVRLTYTVSDGIDFIAATQQFVLTSVNDAPQARNDLLVTDEDVAIAGNVLLDNGNGPDTDIDVDALTVQPAAIMTAAGATVSINADGSFNYTPLKDFNGADSFDYVLLDVHGAQDAGTVTIDVLSVNDAPEALEDNYTGTVNTQITGNVLANDFDVDQNPLNVAAASFTTAHGGLVNISENGVFTYDPVHGFIGDDSFIYTLLDGQGGQDTASVNISVTEVINEIIGTDASDNLIGTNSKDVIRSLGGSYDRITGGLNADIFLFGAEALNGVRERDVILDYEVGVDAILLEDGATIGSIRQTSTGAVIFLEGDFDAIYVNGVSPQAITFV